MLNSVNIIGRLTKDVEVRYTTNGKAVCDFTIACNRLQEGVDFINIQVWGKQAENLVKYTTKGSLISVSGKLRVDTYKDKEGNAKYKNYVLANEIEWITKGKVEEQKNDQQIMMEVINSDDIEVTDLPF